MNSLQKRLTRVQLSNAYVTYKAAAESIRDEAQEMLGALSILHQGIVSNELVNYTQLELSFADVSACFAHITFIALIARLVAV